MKEEMPNLTDIYPCMYVCVYLAPRAEKRIEIGLHLLIL